MKEMKKLQTFLVFTYIAVILDYWFFFFRVLSLLRENRAITAGGFKVLF